MPEGRRDWGWLTLTLVASDLGAVLLAFWLAAALVWRTGVGINGGNDSDWLVLVMVPVLGAIFFAQGLFVFPAEDGIRRTSVTGVQTCALPISRCRDGDG